jgi:hypothetical protein
MPISLGIGTAITRGGGLYGPQPQLDLNFASLLSLTPSVGPTPSFTRASTGTYFDASGVLTTAAINGPRFDYVYNGSSWVSKGLLIEEQRTNLVQYSELVGSTGWSANSAGTTTPVVTANFAAAPNGSTTASKIVFPSASGTQSSKIYQQIASITGAHTISLYLRGDVGGEVVYLIGYNGTSYFFTTCTLTTSWQKFSVSTGSSNQGFLQLGRNDIANGPMSACTVYAWGAQGEAGSFATSYIPNLSNSSATRSADVCQITGGDFTSFWNASEGSFVYEADSFSNVVANQFAFIVSDGTFNNQYQSSRSQNNAYTDIGFWVKAINVWQALINTSAGAWLQGETSKNAMAYKINDYVFCDDGSAVLSDASGTLPTVDRMEIGGSSMISAPLNGHIARLRYFNTRLLNSELVALST